MTFLQFWRRAGFCTGENFAGQNLVVNHLTCDSLMNENAFGASHLEQSFPVEAVSRLQGLCQTVTLLCRCREERDGPLRRSCFYGVFSVFQAEGFGLSPGGCTSSDQALRAVVQILIMTTPHTFWHDVLRC